MIDWDQVRSLRDEVGHEDFAEVIELFIEEVEEVVARLKAQADLGSMENDMHFLKGSSMSLGFSAFSKLCQQGETLSSQGNAGDVDVKAVLSCYASSKSQFMSELETVLG